MFRATQKPKRHPYKLNKPGQSHLIALEPRMMFDGAAPAAAADTLGLDAKFDGASIKNLLGDSSTLALTAALPAAMEPRAATVAGAQMPVVERMARGVLTVQREDLSRRPGLDGWERGFGRDDFRGRSWLEYSEVDGQPAGDDVALSVAAAPANNAFIFIDTAVTDYQQLVSEWQGKGTIILIDATRDGIDQIRTALIGQRDVTAIHIVSHGEEGAIYLGTTRIDQAAVSGVLASSFAAIGDKLTVDGDLLIYGCDVGAGAAGQALVDALARTSGADVAASIDDTGYQLRGGDWALESRLGTIEAATLVAQDWLGLLAPTRLTGVAANLTVVDTNNNPVTISAGGQSAAVGAGAVARWAGVATINGEVVDLLARVVSVGSNDVVRFNRSGTGGTLNDDFGILLQTSGTTGTAAAVIQWEIVRTGTTTQVATDVTFTVADIDGVGGVPLTRESVVVSTDTLSSYQNAAGSRVQFISAPGTITGAGTVDENGAAESGARFNWLNTSAFQITYNLNRANGVTSQALFNHDGDLDFSLGTGGTTVSIPRLDLDRNDSTANGSAAVRTYVEDGPAVTIADSDVAVTNPAGNVTSATITLTNAQAGDVLTYGNLPTGITASVNTSVAGQITVTFSGASTAANYQAAIAAVQFRNNTDTPATVDRNLTTSFSNGTLNSNVAVSTIRVTPVDERPVIDLNGQENEGTAVGWEHNSPANTPNAGRFDNGTVASGTAETFGAGITGNYNNTRVTVSGATSATLEQAIANNDYVQYGFTTAAGISPNTVISGFYNADWGTSAGYKVGVAISTDGFASSTFLTRDFQAVVTGGGAYDPRVNDIPDNYRLSPGTNYQVRVFLYAAEPGVIDFDDFQIFTRPVNLDFTNTFTENGPPVSISDTDDFVADTDDTNMETATITLTNPKAGDRLVVNGSAAATGTLPGGISYVRTDTSVTLTGSATKADYAAAIRAIQFSNTSDTPDTTQRVINVTVGDGELISPTAVARINVIPVNDAPVGVGIPPQASVDRQAVSVSVAPGFKDPESDTLTYALVSGLPAGLTLNSATGVISGTLDRSASQVSGGVYSITVRATDPGGLSTTQTFTWTVTNPAPVAVNDSTTTTEDTPVSFNLLNNDSDPDGDPLTIVSASAANGTVSIGAGGQVTYTPNLNFTGTDTITYQISDGQGGTATATATVTISPVNDAPVRVGTLPPVTGVDAQAVANIPTASGFADVDNPALTFSVVGLPTGLSINATTGVISGTIDRSASQVNGGVYSVTVTARDAAGLSVTQTFTYTVTNPSPVATNDTATTPEDTPVTISVRTNDSDPDGDPLSVSAASATNGTVVRNANGTITYTPNANFSGTDTITYSISDGQGGTSTATVTVTVSAVNDPPPRVGALPPRTNVDAATGISVATAGGFADVDSPTLSYSVTGLPAGLSIDATTGVITGTIDRSASQGGAGGVYSVVVTATDPGGLSTTQTFSWTVTNPAPVAANDAASTTEDTPIANINVLGNDSDPDGDPLTVTAASAVNGTVTINANGTLNYTPNGNFNGTDTITYTISDGQGGTATATVTVTVGAVNDAPVSNPIAPRTSVDSASPLISVFNAFADPDGGRLTFSAAGLPAGLTIDPSTGDITGTLAANASQGGPASDGIYQITVTATDLGGQTTSQTFALTVTNPAPIAANDTATTAEDTPVLISVLPNDSDPDGDPLTVISAFTSLGQATIVGNQVQYTPPPNYNGPATITYTISDGQGGTSTATITVNVTPVNDAPVATPIAAQTNIDNAAVSVPVAASFSDVDGDALTYSATGLPAGLTINAATGVISGTIDNSASQVNGGVYSATVTASDGNGGTVSQTFSWTVTNPAPVATNDSASTPEDTPVTIAVLANDADPDGDALTVTSASALNGTVVINPNGSLTYTPAAGFNGTDTITYQISDGEGGTSTATVTVSVADVNDEPTSSAIANQTNLDSQIINLPVAGAFADPDGDTLSYAAAGLPAGLAIDPATGVISGTIDNSASQVNGGVYAITVTASDGRGGTVSSTFTWTVTNPAPTAANDAVTTAEDTPVRVPVLANDGDPDGDPLTVSAASAGNGTVSINADGSLLYTPNPNFNGTDTIIYRITDSEGGVSTASVTVTITAMNDGPTTVGIPNQNGDDGQPTSVSVASAFSDVDGDVLTFSATGLPPNLTIDPLTGVISGTLGPDTSQNGPYVVSVTATDPSGASVTTDFVWSVQNVPPVAVNDVATTAEDTPITVGVLTNDSDPDGDPLTITAASATNGTVVINPNGTVTFTPAPNFNGEAVVTYTVSDGEGGFATATLTVTVTAVNDAPTSVALPNEFNQDSDTVSVNVGSFFSDIDGDTLSLSATGLPAGLTMDAAGVISGTIDPGASQPGGGVYSVTVTATDPGGLTTSRTFTWTVTNPAPTATDDAVTTAEDTPIPAINVLGNDTDPDGDVLTVTAAAALNGTVTVNPNGTLAYTPNANFNGTDTVTYTISDGNGGTSTATVAITVTPVNDPPVAVDDRASTNEDTPVTIGVLGNDTDVDGDVLIVTAATSPNGTVVINPDGTLTFTPAPNFNGPTTITYTVSDGNGGTATATVTVNVGAVNDTPVANPDTATTPEDTLVNIPVLGNDSDPDGDPLTVTAASAPNGTVTIRPDGTLDYTPNPNFNGTETITYTISDGNGGFATSTVTVTVTAVNDAPVATPIAPQQKNDSDTVNLPVAGNFSDLDGNPLTFSATGLPAGLTISPAGVISGTIDRNASQVNGGVYSVTVTAIDGNGGTVSTTFTYTVGNPVPLATNDSATTPEDTPVTVPVLANDSDPDGDPLTVTSAIAPNGTVVINPDGTVTYTPNPNFNGTDTITYTVSDGNGGTATAIVTITVTATNDAPTVATPIPSQSENDGSPVNLPVAGNFTDLDGDPLTFTATGLPAGLTISPAGVITGTIDKNASQGGPNADGIYTVTVTASDGQGGTVTSTFTYTVGNPPPAAANDSATTPEDTPVTVAVLANDTDPDADPLTVISATAPNGTVVINPDGTITYTPNADFNGTDTVTYTISDGNGGTSTATVAITVTPGNDLPIVDAPIPNQVLVDSDIVSLPVSANFSDVDGDPLSFTATGLPAGLTISPTGVIAGTIDRNASQVNGGVYTVTVTAIDGQGGTVSTSFTINVSNPPPTAVNDTATTSEDTATAPIAVLANDGDPDGDPLTVVSATAPNGTVVINPDGTLVYTPNANFNGTDVITYAISDGNGGTSTATVTVTVTSVNDVPVGTPITPQSDNDAETVSVPVAGNFSDADGDPLTFTATGLPAGLTISPAGVISGTIDRGASQINGGVYSVTVTASDGNGGSTSQTFTWTVANPAPTAVDDTATTSEETPTAPIAVLANDSDPDGDVLTVTTATAPNGTVVINPDGTLVYTPNANFNGTDTITYTISDGNGGTSTATVLVTVTAVNDVPTADVAIPPQTNVDSDAVSLPIGGNFSDADGDALTFTATGLPAGLTISPAGVISGTIDRGASQVAGGVYTVVITASDGNGGTVTQTFVWTVTNPAPTATNDTATVAEDGSVNIPVLANDTDPDGDVLSVTAATAGNGTVTINPDGTITYAPNPNFNGTDTISYTLSDGNGGSSTATVTVIVTPVNDAPTTIGLPNLFDTNSEFVATQIAGAFADVDGNTLTFGATGLPTGLSINPATGAITGQISPTASSGGPNGDGVYSVTITADDGNGRTVSTIFDWTISNVPPTAVDDAYVTGEDVPITVAVTANDIDPDGDPGTPVVILDAVPTNGTVIINADNTLTFTPTPDFTGVATVTYTISDGLGGFSTAVATITINPVNDAPASDPLANQTSVDGQSVTVPLGPLFSDVDNATLSFSAAGLPDGLTIDPATGSISGVIDKAASQNNNGTYIVTVTATDAGGLSVSAVFTWTITNPAPNAVDDSASTSEDVPVDIPVLANDTDPDGDALTVTSAIAGNGTVTIGAGGVLTYTPNADFNGTDTITYTIDDGNGGTSTATVTVAVGAVNDAPTAAPIPGQAALDNDVINLPVAGSFSDLDGDTLTFTAIDLPPGLSISPTGVITGTIDNSASQAGGGVYTATITASDGNGGTVTQTVTFTIANPGPTADDEAVTTAEDALINIPVLVGDVDPDGDTLTITAASAANGTVTIRPDGTLDYTPNADFNGVDVITYTISDGEGGTATATVTVTVTPANDAPVAVPVSDRADADADDFTGTNALDVSGNFSDVDGDPLTFTAAGLPPGLTMSSAGLISGVITPDASQTGPYTVTVTASDGNGGTASTIFTWTVTNPAPTATDDTATTNEDTSVNIAVLLNDTDPDGDALTVTAASAGNGTVTIRPDGTLDYTPNANFNGTDTITYTISDGNGGASSATVTITVSPVNDLPVATPLADRTDTDSENFTGSNAVDVSGNFSDADGDPLTFTATGLPPGLTMDAAGVISGTITPSASQTGPYTVTITANDGNGGTASTSFVWAVTNPGPVATNDSVTTPEETLVNIPVLANDSDPDSDPLTVTTASAGSGTVVIRPDGTLDYTPNPDFTGTDTISYTISDGNGGTSTATVAVTVSPVNDNPVAVPDATTTPEDTPVIIPVLANDSDVDGDPLTVASATSPDGTIAINPDGTITFTPNPNFNGTATITYVVSDGQGGTATSTARVIVTPINDVPVAVNDAGTTPEDTPVTIPVRANDTDADGDPLTVTAATSPDGQVTINPDGTVTFTPAPNFNGTTTITYTVSDGQGGTATAIVTLTVSPVNDPPVAVNDAAVTNEDTPVSISVLANDTDADGNPLTVTAATAPNGTLVINPDGTVTYTPNPNFNGVDTITYTISDGQGGTTTATVTVTVNAVNDVPIAVNDTATTPEDAPVTIPVLGNDSDADGDPLTVTAATSPNGTVVINPDGTITFTPAPNFNGPTTITYTVSDGKGGTATATVNLTVTPVNDPPVAVPDTAATNEDTPVRLTPLANDTDADGNPLSVVEASSPNGTVTINPDGSITYTPNPNFNGTDIITYTVSDGQGGTSTATISVTVAPVNDPPVAVNDVIGTDEDVPVRIPVLSNDSDADGDPLTVTAASAPNGTVVINPDGTVTYTPRADFSGTDTVTYTISDGQGGTSTATVTVTVRNTNERPSDGDEAVFAVGGSPRVIDVLANASDPEGNPLTVFTAKVDIGTVTINPDGTLTYLADPEFQGVATITYIVSDGRGGFVESVAVVTVTQANADVNALLGAKAAAIPDGWKVERVRDQSEEFVRTPLIILETANGFRDLNGTPDLTVRLPLLEAVNRIDWLRGTTPLDGENGAIDGVTGYIDRIRDLRFGVDRLFDPRLGDFSIDTLTGFSVRQLTGGNDQVMIESVVRDRVVYMEVRDLGKPGAPAIVEFQLRMRDSKPLPDWLRFDSRGLAIIERPLDADTIRLIVRAVRADGSVVEVPVIIQGATGEIQLDDPVKAKLRTSDATPLGATMALAEASAAQEAAKLAAAFNGQA